jgi:hypothetical protein
MSDEKLLVIVDADTLAGWRRERSSLQQLHDAVRDLKAQAPTATVAVIADASLKWALSEDERELIETDIVQGDLLFSPAGCVDGHLGFIGRVVEKAQASGYATVAITDRALPDCPLVKIRKSPTGGWLFDLEATTHAPKAAVEANRARGPRRRRRR